MDAACRQTCEHLAASVAALEAELRNVEAAIERYQQLRTELEQKIVATRVAHETIKDLTSGDGGPLVVIREPQDGGFTA